VHRGQFKRNLTSFSGGADFWQIECKIPTISKPGSREGMDLKALKNLAPGNIIITF